MSIDAVLARIDRDLDQSLERLFALLRIPSISTDPAYREPCREAAQLLVDELNGLGFQASVRPTDGQPMVVAHYPGEGLDPDKRVLFYGHYDVQPVDPLELWDSDPFEPRIVTREDGSKMIVARGAADDKGQLMTFVEAARAWIAETGSLPVPVTILFEGEEESGSPSLAPFLNAHADELKAGAALVCDTGMWDKDTPAISVSLRGLVTQEFTVTAADKDLHSGLFGGAARNPNHVLARIIADLHDADGRVQIPGFYEGVAETPADVRAQWDGLEFSEEEFLGQVGLKLPAGERGRSVLEQIWARPTVEVNGMIGGYTGAGFKTVIPSQASAKVSFRLVGEQDPQALMEAFQAFVRARIPEDCTVSFTNHGASPALRIPLDSPILKTGREALEAEWDTEPLMIGMGGSIPIVGAFKTKLGMDTLLVGFGLDDDRIHSPNEKYEMSSFHKGMRSWARMLGMM
ncbi:M20/M25/M40 family metallo-hydrolase [Amorphus coralli]|uniref:M20/M25/M40 family metallo-hydrolase n=1 Tax=Amorphus coralli TaxID=340680 RepID=UPI0003761EF9|nr:M20/M25/M40 family metallo-hydrolase [Amorphus coralli]